jgi:uncharacterized membrane protein YhaH (DUF805 family)
MTVNVHSTFWVVATFVFSPVAFVGILVALFWLLAVGTKRSHERGTWMIAFLLPAWVLNLASEFVDRSAIAGKYWISLAISIAAGASQSGAWTDARHDRRQSILRRLARSVV